MEVHRTEEEQIDAIKKWWKSNGSSLIIGIGIALALVFGWQAFEKKMAAERYEASSLYQQVLEASNKMNLADGEDAEKTISTMNLLLDKLKDGHGDSVYASYAGMVLAKAYVAQGDFEKAENEVRWVLSQKLLPSYKAVVETRLARILSESGQFDDALAIVDGIKAGELFEPKRLEVKGDILVAKGDLNEARIAYQAAADLIEQKNEKSPLLELKLYDLSDENGLSGITSEFE
ncbi:MAG: tetratricopeptide repeat protein [Pseudomonadales bacterium]|uniref:Ancillary SecYEG translocon subunit n=1 Tax=Oleiphilus messinensis TaxID=141451 RepID=A0A1Y0I8M3_9GAMM|nr:tetratricopeptide repeat protein [Oleiphilus messinensis]ARU56549.1 hypothetical protein OLMES_2489 [Oleiphilus messinensis]MCG8608981.1 tetratricopeptide repeat protein [Pseudomonadales bacterium]